MDRITSRFLIYGGLPEDSVLMQLAEVCRILRAGEYDPNEITSHVYAQIKKILVISTDYNFDGNLWQNYLTYLLVTAENPFTLTAEKTGGSDGTVNHFAKSDFTAFIELFHYDFSWIEELLQTDVFSCITDYKAIRASALYKADEAATLRKSHENPEIIKLYNEFLEKPNSHKAHQLLHTSYVARGKYKD